MAQKANSGDTSRIANWQPHRPYNDLPRLPPTAELETKTVLKQCVTARAALAELKQAVALIPNPAMLINTLPLLEARASSEIENIVTTADKLFQHLQADSGADPATREALRYRRALLDGVKALKTRPLTTGTAESICTRIKGVRMSVRKAAGTALANDATGVVVYTPPEGEARIRDLLANWERFLHEEESLDPLVRMAAVFPNVDPLPGSQREGATRHRDAQVHGGQCGAHVRGHVVLTFASVSEQRITVRRQACKKLFKVAAHFGIGVFLNQQRRRGVPDLQSQQTVFEPGLTNPRGDFASELVETAAAAGDLKFMYGLAHRQLLNQLL